MNMENGTLNIEHKHIWNKRNPCTALISLFNIHLAILAFFAALLESKPHLTQATKTNTKEEKDIINSVVPFYYLKQH